MAITKISTASIEDDAITSAKIPTDAVGSSEIDAGAVGNSELNNNSVDTTKIADQAVTLAKLEHGTSSNNGKFLRANNGADPTFEDVPAGGISDVVSDTSPQLGGDLQSNGNDIDFADSDKAVFGAGDDLQIYHDGNHSIIKDSGTGQLRIQSNAFSVENAAGVENMIFADEDGAVTLYHDNSAKFATTSTGVNVTGGIRIGGNNAANELDDYEEGTWTPTVNSGTVGQASTAIYTKVGQMVDLQFGLYQFSDSTSSNGIDIGGIPFTAQGQAVGTWAAQRVDTDGLGTFCTIYGGGTVIQLLLNTGDTTANTMGTICTHSRLAQTLAYQFMSLTYRTA